MSRETGIIYFVQGESGGPIKIGYTKNIEKRLTLLQSGYPDRLILLASMAGTEENEEAIHIELQQYRLRGEWFSPHENVLEKVKAINNCQEVIQKGDYTKKTCAILRIKEVEAFREKGLTAEELGCLVYLIPHVELGTGKLVYGRKKQNMKYKNIVDIFGYSSRKSSRIINSLKNHGLILYDKGYYMSGNILA